MNKLLKSIAFGALPILLFSSTLNASHQPQPFTTEELIAFCRGQKGCIEGVRYDKELSLESTQLTDGNIIRFNATLNMAYSLGVFEITDELISMISQLNNITSMSFLAKERGDFHEVLQKLSSPEKLELISIGGAGEDKHLSVLKRFGNLKKLFFEKDSGVTDEGLRHLQNLQIEWLSLTDNKAVTDNGVNSIKKIRTLRKIGLRGTSITDEGGAKIRAALPRADVQY